MNTPYPASSPPPNPTRYWLFVGIAVVLAAGGVYFLKQRAASTQVASGGFGFGPGGPPGGGAPAASSSGGGKRGAGGSGRSGGGGGGAITVGISQVTTGDVPIVVNALGTVTPLATVTVHPQVSGPLVRVAFTEGQMVKKGDVLAQIDPRPFQAAVDQARAALQRDQATLDNARIDLKRYKELLAEQSVSDQQYVTQEATVNQSVATVAADKAALQTAQLNLDYCRITAPVDGLVGLRQVDIGNLLQANASTVVVVTQMQPMSVVFTVPQDQIDNVLKRVHAGIALQAEAWDSAFKQKIAIGKLSSTDNQIDTSTGTLKLRALFDNSQRQLFPNQFVNIKLTLDTLANQVLVSGAAVLGGASGNYVYLVDKASSTVTMQLVSVGPTVGDKVSITQGLSPGQIVVVDGADQLRDKATVVLPGSADAYVPPTHGSSSSSGDTSGDRHHRHDGASSGGASSSGGSHWHQGSGNNTP